jgi:ABC-type microcin C transport system duplicated ATPase subunit YejF
MTNGTAPSIGNLLKEVGDIFESQQNKYNRALFEAQPPGQQVATLQAAYDNGMKVEQISKMTGMAKSTIYTKIKTK